MNPNMAQIPTGLTRSCSSGLASASRVSSPSATTPSAGPSR